MSKETFKLLPAGDNDLIDVERLVKIVTGREYRSLSQAEVITALRLYYDMKRLGCYSVI